jgi:hypothetical protein
MDYEGLENLCNEEDESTDRNPARYIPFPFLPFNFADFFCRYDANTDLDNLGTVFMYVYNQ